MKDRVGLLNLTLWSLLLLIAYHTISDYGAETNAVVSFCLICALCSLLPLFAPKFKESVNERISLLPIPHQFSDVHHLEPLVIQHIGVYTISPPTSPLVPHSELPSESHTQEIVKLSSFLSTSSKPPSTRPIISSIDTRASVHTILSHSKSSSRLRLPKFTSISAGTGSQLTASTATNTTEEPQREKSASSPAAITAGEEGFIKKDTPLRTLCSQFLSSMYGNHQSAEFWRRCVSCVMDFSDYF
ncbi:unnamed protein product [Rodentolepis nana]|uniref:RGS domain-containing protein n=1 Tax=Rodentolepis nana TaxID=102285 RepID=A0A0R3TVL1_RODNA|nr:unnamed protein product [Rodentolepis nana]